MKTVLENTTGACLKLALVAMFSALLLTPLSANAVQVYNWVWVAPTTTVAGTDLPVSEIGGFNLHCGLVSGSYTKIFNVPSNTATTEPIADHISVTTGRVFCRVGTYNVSLEEGPLSTETAFDVNGAGVYMEVPKTPGAATSFGTQ